MQTHLDREFAGTDLGAQAEAIVRKCVHCGFCLATCPTYQILGDELDSPRGRIYLIKQILEGKPATRSTQIHLDRCLTCRNCETTCPSGVEYGALVEIGRRIVEDRVPRPPAERAMRWLLKEGLLSRAFAPALRFGALLGPMLPPALRAKLPREPTAGPRTSTTPSNGRTAVRAPRWPAAVHTRRVLLLAGCVQPGLQPNINPATARVLDAAGVQSIVATGAGCCGAIRTHLADHEAGLGDMRRNIDAWWPYLEGSDGKPAAESVVINASGCGVLVKEYGMHLAHDPRYAHKAQVVSERTRDLCEFVAPLVSTLRARIHPERRQMALHLPCTLQHGQALPDLLESVLRDLGFEVSVSSQEHHLCCGSAGTYSVLQPELANRLRDRKLVHLRALGAPYIVSANIGCIQHLQSGTELPVRHWIEVLDEAMGPESLRD